LLNLSNLKLFNIRVDVKNALKIKNLILFAGYDDIMILVNANNFLIKRENTKAHSFNVS
jgi:hypothetical protein